MSAQIEKMEQRHQEEQERHRQEQAATVANIAQQLAASNALHELLRTMGFTPPPLGPPPGSPIS